MNDLFWYDLWGSSTVFSKCHSNCLSYPSNDEHQYLVYQSNMRRISYLSCLLLRSGKSIGTIVWLASVLIIGVYSLWISLLNVSKINNKLMSMWNYTMLYMLTSLSFRLSEKHYTSLLHILHLFINRKQWEILFDICFRNKYSSLPLIHSWIECTKLTIIFESAHGISSNIQRISIISKQMAFWKFRLYP
jgi:hypothetical protein